jgi:predicted unusual protein kinase regulating ubiquinone biosynthesis (AarF/ABC1/UbiB family)
MSQEKNTFGGRVRRYARVGAGVGAYAVRRAGRHVMGGDASRERDAAELKAALGGLKGPIMKLAQTMATIPDAVPAEYAAELATLQTNAPSMGWPFVRRRMRAELGPDWQSRFKAFEHEAAAAASLGQVHKAASHDDRLLACKLQYPEMQSAVEADLHQLRLIFSIYRRMDPAIDPSEIGAEIGARLREELDYAREAAHMRLYLALLAGEPDVRVPEVVGELSTPRLLTMTWLEGRPILEYKSASQDVRNRLSELLFEAWWAPFSRCAVIHGDPHLGNYSVWEEDGRAGLNLLDFGCVRIFPAHFIRGVVELYHAIRQEDREAMVAAYEIWGFRNLSNELIDALTIWARFIYGPLLDDRVRTVADGISPGEYGRREAFEVHRQLKEHGPVTPPREFVFMDRAAIGLGSVFLHLGAELNFYRLFNEAIADFDVDKVAAAQTDALDKAGVPPRADMEPIAP